MTEGSCIFSFKKSVRMSFFFYDVQLRYFKLEHARAVAVEVKYGKKPVGPGEEPGPGTAAPRFRQFLTCPSLLLLCRLVSQSLER